MNRKWKRLGQVLGFGLLLAILVVEIVTFNPSRTHTIQDAGPMPTPPPIEVKTSAVETTSQEMSGAHVFGITNGRKEWELDAQQGQGFKDKGTWRLKKVKVKFFGNSNVEYLVSGDEGTVETETKDMEISGNVLTTTSDGYVVKSGAVKYLAKEKLLSTAEAFDLMGPETSDGQIRIVGAGFEADLKTNEMTLKQNVKAEKLFKNNRYMQIRSHHAKVKGKANMARFEQNVQVDMDQVRMTGDRADFLYAPGGNLKSLLLEGNVRVTDRERLAVSRRAEILFAQNEFVLSGDPRVMQGENELRGEEIRFIDGGKEIRVIKAKARVDGEVRRKL
ncbi:MAG: LPS export ABC transporter periplasmic protein LptC [Oligoflexia bacterium]|nr:LPS export ABC transporter periplasmic protein LptC [Oligoflexia bacterium]